MKVLIQTLFASCMIWIGWVNLPAQQTASQSLSSAATADMDQESELSPKTTEQKFDLLKERLQQKWPNNGLVRIVFHGHSVPAGYFQAANVRRFDSYPILFHQQLCKQYDTAVIDVCVSAIGGEASPAGAKRFETEVLNLKPDVVFIDYSLNDRGPGLAAAETAWRSMIEQALAADKIVVLLTPTPDSNEDILSETATLATHAAQVRQLATEYQIPMIDSYAAFKQLVADGNKIDQYLSQPNHPNRAGHEIVAKMIVDLFGD